VSLPGTRERLERAPEFELRTEGGEPFFVHASGDKVLTDALGAAIWQALPATEDEVAARVREALNAPEELVLGVARLMRAAGVARAARGVQAPLPEVPAAQGPGRADAGSGGRVSVVVVAHSSEKDIRACLDSVLAQTRPAAEVLVVDNASKDGTARIVAEEYTGQGVRLLVSKRNRNFAGGANFGLRKARGEFVLVLNADTALEPDAVARLTAKLEAVPRAAAVAPQIRFFKLRMFLNGIGNHVRDRGWGSDNFIGTVDVGQFARLEEVPSACFGAVLLRREALRDVGLLDRGYGAYYEDVDWSFRAWFRGWTIVAEPRAVVYHKFGASFGGAADRKLRLVVRNRQRLILKLFHGRTRREFFRRYLEEDMRTFGSARRGRAGGRATARAYGRAYLSLALGLPGLLVKRSLAARTRPGGVREEEVLGRNPDRWSCLDPRGLPQLNARVYLAYYRGETTLPPGPEADSAAIDCIVSGQRVHLRESV
jgi:GT2 family glycosyltransferase